jgi:PmbA protein
VEACDWLGYEKSSRATVIGMDSRLQRITNLVAHAKKMGARGSEVLSTVSHGTEIDFQRGRVCGEKEQRQERVSVRCWLDGGCAGVAVGLLDGAEKLVEQALEAAQHSEASPVEGPVARLKSVPGGLGIDDRRFATTPLTEKVDVLANAERSVSMVDKRVVAGRFVYRDARELRSFANSKGVQLEEASTRFLASGTVNAYCEGRTLEISDEICSRTFASTGSLPFGTRLARQAAGLLVTGESLEGEIRILLAPRVTARLFAHLGEAFEAQSFLNGTFFLQPRDDDEPVVDSRIHLVDDGTAHGAYRTRSFDDRGTLPVPLTLLREGRVSGRFMDPETARRLDTQPSGHVLGDELVASNLLLRSGSRSINAMLTDRDGYCLAIQDLPDLSGLNLLTGQFSVPVHGIVMKGKVPVGAMRHATLSGNMLRMLNQLVEVASDTDRVGHVDAPGMLFDGCVLTA